MLQPAEFKKLRHELDVMWGCAPPEPLPAADSQPPVSLPPPSSRPTDPPRRLLGRAVARDRKRWVRMTPGRLTSRRVKIGMPLACHLEAIIKWELETCDNQINEPVEI